MSAEQINATANVIAAVGALVTPFLAYLVLRLRAEVSVVHKTVNSNLSNAQDKLNDAITEIARLRSVIEGAETTRKELEV